MHQSDPSYDQPALARLRRPAAIAAAAASLFLSAGLAQARDLLSVPDPAVIELSFETDSLYWDLCVGYHKPETELRLVEAIVSSLDAPETYHVLRIPQLPIGWSSPGRGSLTGLHGESVDRRRLGYARGTYEDRVEAALLSVLDAVEQQRPGVRLSIEGFHSVPDRSGREEAYQRLEDRFAYVTLSEAAPATSGATIDAWLEDASVDDDLSLLLRTDDGWHLYAEGWQIRTLTNPAAEDDAAAWPAPSGGTNPDDPEQGPDGETPEGAGPNEGPGVVEIGLGMLSNLRGGRPLPTGVAPGGVPTIPGNGDGGENGDGDGGGEGPDAEPDEPAVEPDPESLPPIFGPLLAPGPGFSAATPQPAAVGAPGNAGYTAQAIARWSTVPFQTVTGPLNVGVVAFHINGIDRVEFSLDGGPWTSVEMPRVNFQNNVVEYFATIDPTSVADGAVEVRARVWPTGAGQPRLLAGPMTKDSVALGEHSMPLNANAGGTLTSVERYVAGAGSDASGDGTAQRPFRTITRAFESIEEAHGSSNGARIRLLPGTYTWGLYSNIRPNTDERWATIEAAEGVDPADVVFNEVGGGGFKTRLINVRNVTIHHPVQFVSSGDEKYVWADGVRAVGDTVVTDVQFFNGNRWTGMYVENSSVSTTRHGVQYATMVRNTSVRNISNDAYSMSRLVLNCEVDRIDNAGTSYHPDVYQFIGVGAEYENFIVFGLRGYNIKAQGIFANGVARVDDIAFVNVLLERDHTLPQGGKACQWIDLSTNHMLMRGVSLVNYAFSFRTTDVENLSVIGSVFDRLKLGTTSDGVRVTIEDLGGNAAFRDNHFIDMEDYGSIAPGSGARTGDPRFRDALHDDFRPSASSPLRDGAFIGAILVDALGAPRENRATRGALEPN